MRFALSPISILQAGIYVPSLAAEIVRHNNAGETPAINLKGIMVGALHRRTSLGSLQGGCCLPVLLTVCVPPFAQATAA